MGQTETLASDSPTSLFRCQPRALKEYARLRYQGALPVPKCLHFLDPIIAVISPVLESFILACLPAVLAGFLLGVVIRYNPPLFWMRLVFSGILAISVVFAVRWFWINPRHDTIELCSGKLHWRISLARL